jgi:hypothetical protein
MPPSKTYIKELATRACRMSIDEIGPLPVGSFSVDSQVDKTLVDHFDFIYYLVWFAAMDEREACAKMCEQQKDRWVDGSDQWGNPCPAKLRVTPSSCAAAIRARSNVQQEPQK